MFKKNVAKERAAKRTGLHLQSHLRENNNATEMTGIKYNTLPDLSTATEARVIWRLDGSAPTNVACAKTPSPTTASANFTIMDCNLGGA